MTSAFGDAVVVGIALRQRLVRGQNLESYATDTWLFVPLDVTV